MGGDRRLCKSSSQELASHSCHVSFLKARKCHNLIPKGLRLTDPIKTQHSKQVLTKASSVLLTERLNHFRHDFSRIKKTLDHIIRQLKGLHDQNSSPQWPEIIHHPQTAHQDSQFFLQTWKKATPLYIPLWGCSHIT